MSAIAVWMYSQFISQLILQRRQQILLRCSFTVGVLLQFLELSLDQQMITLSGRVIFISLNKEGGKCFFYTFQSYQLSRPVATLSSMRSRRLDEGYSPFNFEQLHFGVFFKAPHLPWRVDMFWPLMRGKWATAKLHWCQGKLMTVYPLADSSS